MKLYLLSLGAGLLVGVIYSLLNVRSPAPPLVALLGLLGILLGEQALPFAKRLAQRPAPATEAHGPAAGPAPAPPARHPSCPDGGT